MYYTIQNNQLLTANKKGSLTKFYEDVKPLPNDYVQGKYIVQVNELVFNPEFETQKTQERQAEFEKQFFNIEGVGYYRRQPKGYSSALESVNTAFNAVTIMGKLPENTLTFYQAPDFSIEEQCTEEWLVANSFKNVEMTAQEFGQFYASFITAWNMQEHL